MRRPFPSPKGLLKLFLVIFLTRDRGISGDKVIKLEYRFSDSHFIEI